MHWQKASGYNRRALVEASIDRFKRVIGNDLPLPHRAAPGDGGGHCRRRPESNARGSDVRNLSASPDLGSERRPVASSSPSLQEGLSRRAAGLRWKQRHGISQLPVLVVRSRVDLTAEDTDAIVALLGKIAAERGRIVLVVIDTLASAMRGNENLPDDMGKFVAACGRIRKPAAATS